MAIYELDDKRPNLPSKGNYWIAPNASVIGNVTLHEKVSVWFNTVIRGCLLYTSPSPRDS